MSSASTLNPLDIVRNPDILFTRLGSSHATGSALESRFAKNAAKMHKAQLINVESSRTTEALQMRMAALKAASALKNFKTLAISHETRISIQSEKIQTIERSLSESLTEQQALRAQLHAQTDQIDIQGAQNNDLTRRLTQNEMRCRAIELDLVKARTEVLDRTKLVALIRERNRLSDIESEKLACTVGTGCVVSCVASLFCSPAIAVPLVGGTAASLTLSDAKWKAAAERKKEVLKEIKEIEARLQA